MHNFVGWCFDWIGALSVWRQFEIVPTKGLPSSSIFGFSEFLAVLALLLVVLTASDFRYRYRLSLAVPDLRRLGFWLALLIGVLLLGTDVWFDNGRPTIRLLSNPNNIKAALALAFLLYVFRVIYVAVLQPPRFTARNAKRFFEANYWFIHEGNPDRLQVVAQETGRSLHSIVASAARAMPRSARQQGLLPNMNDYATNFLLLIGDGRFCRVVVDKVPSFAIECFQNVQKVATPQLQIFQFVRNIGQEFIRNTGSSFYQEESGFQSGLMGYGKPTTKVIFGDFGFIERCASEGASPLETEYAELKSYTGKQLQGYVRAALVFFEAYLNETKGYAIPHSFALARLMSSLEYAVSGLRPVDDGTSQNYPQLSAVMDFIKGALKLATKLAPRPATLRISTGVPRDVYDHLAYLVFDVIFGATAVSSPTWLAWDVQYVSVWSAIFGFSGGEANRIVAFKVRRLMYDDIKKMDRFVNFKGARILGYALYVFGLTPVQRHDSHGKWMFPLQKVVLRWTKRNYRRLLSDSPPVANACLVGSLSYDDGHGRLVKTIDGDQRRPPVQEYLELE
jgi:hypothetical protein